MTKETKWMDGLAEYPELDETVRKHIEKNKDIKVTDDEPKESEDWE